MSEETEKGGGKQVIARAAAVLRALENRPEGLSLAQISKITDLPKTTVHRIVIALEAQQMTIANANGVKLGPAITRLAASAHSDVVTIARPFIEALGRRTRETVDVSIYRGQHSVSIDQYASDQELRVISPVGTAFPIHCTAHGKAILSHLPESTIKAVLNEQLEQRTQNTIIYRDQLFEHLAKTKSQGVFIDEEEHALGVCGIGVILKTTSYEQYAISLAVPTMRFKEKFEYLKTALLQCKAEIEAVIGN